MCLWVCVCVVKWGYTKTYLIHKVIHVALGLVPLRDMCQSFRLRPTATLYIIHRLLHATYQKDVYMSLAIEKHA